MLSLITAGFLLLPPIDPGLPTPPPPLPTQISNPDGTRVTCTPGYTQCWTDTTGLPS